MGLGNASRLVLYSKLSYFDQPFALIRYNKSKQRLLFLSADSIIVPSSSHYHNTVNLAEEGPSTTILSALKHICNDKKTIVCIISEKSRSYLNNHFQGINGLVVSSENGYFYKQISAEAPTDWSVIISGNL